MSGGLLRKAFIVAALVVALGLITPLPSSTALMRALLNLAHAPVFMALAVFGASVAKGHRSARGLSVRTFYSLLTGIVMILGVGAEALQIPFSRDASWGDVALNIVGGLCGLGFAAVFDPRLVRRLRLFVFFLAAAPMVAVGAFAHILVARHVEKIRAFPSLMDASQCGQVRLLVPQWSELECVELPSRWARFDGEMAARVDLLQGGPWPGFAIIEPVPDWTGYRRLLVELVNPFAETLDLLIRVHDRAHNHEHGDRYNRAYKLDSQSRVTWAIDLEDVKAAPGGRVMDMRRIDGIVLFAADATKDVPATFYLIKVWLE